MLELTDKAMNIFVSHYLAFCLGWGLARYTHHATRRPNGLRWHNWVDIIIPLPLGWMIYWWAAARRARRR